MNEKNNTSSNNIYKNINDFAIENNTFILYLTYSNKKLLPFEKELKTIIDDNNLKNNFVYVDIDKIENLNKIINDFSSKNYNYTKKQAPLFLYFKDGRIIEIIDNYNLNIEYVKNKFIELGVIQ